MRGPDTTVLERIPRLRRVALVMVGDRARGDALVEHALRQGLASPDTRLDDRALTVRLFRSMWTAMMSDYGSYAAGDRPDASAMAQAARLANGGTATGPAIERGLAMMPPEMRMTLVLVVMEGMRYEDAAAVTGVSLATLRTRLRQAREILYEAALGEAPHRPADREGSLAHVPRH